MVWNVPVVANIVVNGSAWNSTYKSIIPESIGKFAFNLGGMITRTGNLELAAAQALLMLAYGTYMVAAGSIYEWAPNQSH